MTPTPSLTITYKCLSGLEIPSNQGLIKLNFGSSKSSEIRSDEITESNLFLELAPETSDDEGTITWLKSLIQKPVIISIIESVITKDKKGKETEKQTLLGQTSLDLLGFLTSGEVCSVEKSFVYKLGMPSSNSPSVLNTGNPAIGGDTPSAAEVTLEISSPFALLNDSLLGHYWNVVDFRILSTSIPDDCLTKDQDFLAFISILNENILFSSSDTNIGCINANAYKLKWSVSPELVEIEQAADIQEQNPVISDTKFGDLVGSVGQSKKAEMESGMSKINFVQNKRLLLTHREITNLENSLSRQNSMTVYVGARASDESLPSGKGGKTAPKASQEKQNKLKSIGQVEIDLRGLLYPGRSQIFGSYLVKPISENDLAIKKSSDGLCGEDPADEQHNLASTDDAKFSSTNLGGTATSAAQLLESKFNFSKSEDLVRISNGFLTVDVKMHRPIVESRKIENTVEEISEMIPERGQWPRIERGASHAVLFLKGEIKKLAEFTLDKIRVTLGDVSKIPMEQREEAKRNLFYDLTISPDYQQFKEQLMYAIIRIVREKYLKTTKFSSRTECEEFLSNLSIYLHEVLHKTITEYFYVPSDTVDVRAQSAHGQNQDQNEALLNANTQNSGAPSSPGENSGGITPSQILEFAKEAQSLGKTPVAERWYQELCAREPKNADNWFNYAIFCLSDGDVDKAQQCLCEAISINSNHQKSLICAPFILCMTKHNLDESKVESAAYKNSFIEEGQIFLERAQFNENDNPGLTWTLSALFHEYCMESNCYPKASIMMDQALMKSKELECGQEIDEFITPVSKSLEAARFLINCNLLSFAEKALAHELQHRGTALAMQQALSISEINHEDRVFIAAHTSSQRISEYNSLLGKLHMMRGTSEKLLLAENLFKQATEIYHRYTEAWAMLGHVNYMTGQTDKAMDCYKRVLEDARSVTERNNGYMHLVYLRLGRIYLDKQDYQAAKSVFIDSCNKETPTVHTWLGIGKACYYQKQYNDAEDALAEANMLDQRQPDVWALLSAVCLQQTIQKPTVSRKDEAEQSFKYALKMGCSDQGLLSELAGLQVKAGMGDPSF